MAHGLANITLIPSCCLEHLKIHFYTEELGFIGANIMSRISALKQRMWVLMLSPPKRCGSYKYPQSM